MEKLFTDILWEYVLIYVNYIIIFSRNFDDHLKYFDKIFNILE
jgi:hypothetical protein